MVGAGAGANRQKRLYTCGARTFEHGLAIFRKLRKIDVRVGIGEFHLIQ